jgi:hypothetical protein
VRRSPRDDEGAGGRGARRRGRGGRGPVVPRDGAAARAALTERTRTDFRRPVSPRTIATSCFRTERASARNATRAAFASPSTGGAASWILSRPSCSPATRVRDARGWTSTSSTTPPASSRAKLTRGAPSARF